jgi:hypothetical protein
MPAGVDELGSSELTKSSRSSISLGICRFIASPVVLNRLNDTPCCGLPRATLCYWQPLSRWGAFDQDPRSIHNINELLRAVSRQHCHLHAGRPRAAQDCRSPLEEYLQSKVTRHPAWCLCRQGVDRSKELIRVPDGSGPGGLTYTPRAALTRTP